MSAGNKFKGKMALNFNLTSSHPAVNKLADEIWKKFDTKAIRNKKENKLFLKIVLLNLRLGLLCLRKISYSRDKNQYSALPKRYKHECERHSIVTFVIDSLAKLKYVKPYKASKSITKKYKARRPAITPEFSLTLLLGAIQPNMIEESEQQEIIILRKEVDGRKIEVEYKDTKTTKSNRNDLLLINALRKKHSLCLKNVPMDIFIKYQSHIALHSSHKLEDVTFNKQGKSGIINLRSTYMHRVFNENFLNGGRFFSGTESLLKRELRQYLQVLKDGKPRKTVEADFSGMHPRMMYHIGIEKDYVLDPYASMCKGDFRMRKFYKDILIMMINATDEMKAIRAFRYKKSKKNSYKKIFGALTDAKIQGLINNVKTAHSSVQHLLFKGKGLVYMCIDSRIANEIMLDFARRGIWCGCVHDSFIVERKYKDELVALMRKYYKKWTGFEPGVNIK